VASPNGDYVLTVNLGVEGLFNVTLNHYEIDYARARRGYLDDLMNGGIRNVKVVVAKSR